MELRNKLSARSVILKSEKEEFKRKVRDDNSQDQLSADSSSHNVLIFPATHVRNSKTDHAFQWYYNGFVISIKGKLLIVDPGADFYTRFTNMSLDLNKVRAIFISHEHIDHTASLPVLIDMALRLGIQMDLIAPRDCLESRLPGYLIDEISSGSTSIKIITLTAREHQIPSGLHFSELEKMKIIKLHHSTPQTFGFKLEVDSSVVAYISDTGYAKTIVTNEGKFLPQDVVGNVIAIESKHSSIKDFYSDATDAIVNVNDIAYSRHAASHLTAWDVLDIFKQTKLKNLYLHHQPPYNVRDEDNTIDFCKFFENESYKTEMPFNVTRKI